MWPQNFDEFTKWVRQRLADLCCLHKYVHSHPYKTTSSRDCQAVKWERTCPSHKHVAHLRAHFYRCVFGWMQNAENVLAGKPTSKSIFTSYPLYSAGSSTYPSSEHARCKCDGTVRFFLADSFSNENLLPQNVRYKIGIFLVFLSLGMIFSLT